MNPESEVPEDVLVAAREALASQFERSVGAFPYHPKRIRGGLLDGTYEIRAICRAIMADRSRLTRQEDARKAALEDAAKVAEAWALKSPSQLRLHGGEMTAQEVRTAKAFMTAVCGAIRALKEAGHG